MRPDPRDLKWLSVLFIVALAVRLIPVLLTLDMGIALDDMFQYDSLAESIRLGEGYTWYGGIPTAFRAPLYPVFLAIIYAVFGHQFLAARLVQAATAAFLPLVVYVLGLRLFDGRVAKAAAWVVVFYPMLLLYPVALVTENLFFLLVPLTVLCLIRALDTSRPLYYLLAGLLMGFSILTRSVLGGFLPVLLVWLWYYVPSKTGALKNWGLILLPVALLTIPWSIRNSLLLDQLTFVESSLGFNFYLGYQPDGTGTFDSAVAVDFMEEIGGFEAPDLRTEKLAHNLGMERGLAFIKQDPPRAAWLLLSKLSHFLRLDKRVALFFYSNNFLGALPNPVLLLLLLTLCLPWVVVLLLSVAGMTFTDISSGKTLIYLLLLYYTGTHVVIMSEPRFHLVLVPFLAIFAVQGARTLRRVREVVGDPHARWRLALCLGVVALLILNWVYELNVDMAKLAAIFSPGGNTARLTY